MKISILNVIKGYKPEQICWYPSGGLDFENLNLWSANNGSTLNPQLFILSDTGYDCDPIQQAVTCENHNDQTINIDTQIIHGQLVHISPIPFWLFSIGRHKIVLLRTSNENLYNYFNENKIIFCCFMIRKHMDCFFYNDFYLQNYLHLDIKEIIGSRKYIPGLFNAEIHNQFDKNLHIDKKYLFNSNNSFIWNSPIYYDTEMNNFVWHRTN